MVFILYVLKYYFYKVSTFFSTRYNVVKSLNYFYIKIDKSVIGIAKYFASTCVGRVIFARFNRPPESVMRRRLRYLENFIFTFVITLILIASIGHIYSGNLDNMTKNHLVIAPFVTMSLLVCTFSNLFMAAYTDPGTIPRALNQQKTGWLTKPPVQMFVNVRDQEIKLSWCETCGFWRPPRASHCRTCDRCVMKLDHHCPWLSNCIGARNYKYFVWFVIWFNCLMAWGIITSLTHLSDMAKEAGVPLNVKTFLKLLGFSPWTLIVLTLICFSIPMPMLMLFHLYIIAIAMTTREMIGWRNLNLGCGVKFSSPYSKGSVFLNYIEIFWGPTPPLLIRNSPKNCGYVKCEGPDKSLPFAMNGRPIKESIVKLV